MKSTTNPSPTKMDTNRLSSLAGYDIFIVGGVHDPVLLQRHRHASFTLKWVHGNNPRQIQSLADRVRSGSIDALIFLHDLNGHASYALLRKAAKASGTPMVLSAKSVSAIERTLEQIAHDVHGRKAA